MIVCKAFLKVIRKNIGMIIIYTVIFLVFSVANSRTGETQTTFVSEKPSVCLVTEDDSLLSDCLCRYIGEHMEIVDLPEQDRADALFYKEICSIIRIPKHYGRNVCSGEQTAVGIQTSVDYKAEFVKLMLERFGRVQNIYVKTTDSEQELVNAIESALESSVKVEVASALDEKALTAASDFYNFAAYSMMACIVFIICLVLSSFNEIMIRKRTLVSSMPYGKYSTLLMLSSCLYAMAVWAVLVLLSFCIVPDGMKTDRGIWYVMNGCLYMLVSLTLAYLLSTVLKGKNAITGIVNVITLGCSFLCGVFVPADYLPDSVMAVARVLPTYWYVQTNELLKTTETLDKTTVLPILIHFAVLSGFCVLFYAAGMMISRHNRRIA